MRFFFLRIWRQFIIAHKTHRLSDNFISSNTYTCIEVNARTLVLLTKQFRDRNMTSEFLPVLFDSQTCEKSFRLFRSMGTMEFTRINFTFYDLTFMIGRLEVMNEIAYTKCTQDELVFPSIRQTKSTTYELPSDIQINAAIDKAKIEAIQDAEKFGMVCSENIDQYNISSRINFTTVPEEDIDDFGECFDSNEYESTILDPITENNDASPDQAHDCASAFVQITDESGVQRKVRKSTFIWMLTEPSQFLSKDRLSRFRSRKRKEPI